jgi:hypothetical protein
MTSPRAISSREYCQEYQKNQAKVLSEYSQVFLPYCETNEASGVWVAQCVVVLEKREIEIHDWRALSIRPVSGSNMR